MADFRTSGYKRTGQQEIVLHVSDSAHIRPQWLLDFFEHAMASGRHFDDGQTLQIGWMITKLVANPEGDLDVWEPRLGPVPIQWVRGVNNTIRHLTLQKSVSELLGCEPDFPSILQAAAVTSSFLAAHKDVFICRMAPSMKFSGWRCSQQRLEESQDELKSLFEIASTHPNLVPFLALPNGASVSCSKTEVTIEYAGQQISSNHSDLLRRINERAPR